jgi:hypothetical protein
MVKAVHVQVPATTAIAEMTQWGRDLEASEEAAGKSFMANFYNTDWPAPRP